MLTTIRWCVTNPDDCQIDIHPHEGSTVIDVAPHPDDFRHLVGARGRLASAIRTILGVFNRRFNHNIVFHVMEPEGLSSAAGGGEEMPREAAGDD